MSPTTHLGRKFDADSISGIRMDVRARLGVHWEENPTIRTLLYGERPYFRVGCSCFVFFACLKCQ